VATKCGRQINPHVNNGYQPEVLRKYVEDSLRNLGLETIDLIQLHCPPTPVYQRDEIFELFEKLKEEGKIQQMGVSVEQVNEAMTALKYDIVSTVQIIFNMFRIKPSELFFSHAQINNLGIIVRVPLASGLLTGKLTSATQFDPNDHRSFNRNGEAFDKGETFSGVPYEKGLAAVEELKEIFKGDEKLVLWAIRWVLMFPQISTVIPGASKVEQVTSNVRAGNLPALSEHEMKAVQQVYEKYIKEDVHQEW
jgi:aryl-alcohol dehydrogenase-like predicted oxidoreductase